MLASNIVLVYDLSLFLDKLQNHKWENAFTVDRTSWGFRREATLSDFLSIEDILEELASTVRYVGRSSTV